MEKSAEIILIKALAVICIVLGIGLILSIGISGAIDFHFWPLFDHKIPDALMSLGLAAGFITGGDWVLIEKILVS